MSKLDFVATQDFKSPYVISTGQPHRPTAIKTKQFKKGDIIVGEMKTANGKPAFVLWKGVVVVPLSCVKQVITKDINASSADGMVTSDKPKTVIVKEKQKEGKKQYIDAAIIGAVIGFGAAYFAEKKAWIAEQPNHKNKLIGAAIGAAAGMYWIYRNKK